MFDSKTSQDDENCQEIEIIYETIKSLVRRSEIKSARHFLRENKFSENWEQLLHHSMVRRNCPVTKLIVVEIANSRFLTPDEICRKISVVDHQITLAFAKRVKDYIGSDEFDKEFQKYENVRRTAASQMQYRIGRNLLNPNKF